MSWAPLKTLTGRLVLVTLIAVTLAYATAFLIYANERGAALRRSLENNAVERIAYAAEQLRDAPAPRRPAHADSMRDFSIRYSVTAEPETLRNAPPGGAAGRMARGVSQALGGAETHATARL
ncbi:MAG TPA: hypothetical protein PKY87_14260, partial [Terricaulis sp.]|nr:hypothetical protein [Terricaulis sp.]